MTAASGTEFLTRKKAAKDARQQVVAGALAEADRLFDALTDLADDSRRRTPAVEGPASRMVLDAAFLVPRRAARRFRAAASAAARALAARGFELSVTGPVAPLPLRGGRGVSRASGVPARRDAKALFDDTDATLLDLVDNILTKGVVIDAEVVLGLAGVDLVYVRLSALVSAADKMRRVLAE